MNKRVETHVIGVVQSGLYTLFCPPPPLPRLGFLQTLESRPRGSSETSMYDLMLVSFVMSFVRVGHSRCLLSKYCEDRWAHDSRVAHKQTLKVL